VFAAATVILAWGTVGHASAATAHHHARSVREQRNVAHHVAFASRHRQVRPVAACLIPSSPSGHAGDISPTIIRALLKAQATVGVDPPLLLGIASTESGLNPKARNRHSSAQGLLQFTNTTWLTVVRDFGARHGLAQYAASISTDQDGRLSVRKARLRRAILALRNDPLLEAIMTAERLEQERGSLEAHLGRPVQSADLYFIHLLGPAGATRFLTEMEANPMASSVATVGSVATPNAGLFIKDGRPMTVAEAYAHVQSVLDEQVSRYSTLFPPSVATSQIID
jgi:hypothetical protein